MQAGIKGNVCPLCLLKQDKDKDIQPLKKDNKAKPKRSRKNKDEVKVVTPRQMHNIFMSYMEKAMTNKMEEVVGDDEDLLEWTKSTTNAPQITSTDLENKQRVIQHIVQNIEHFLATGPQRSFHPRAMTSKKRTFSEQLTFLLKQAEGKDNASSSMLLMDQLPLCSTSALKFAEEFVKSAKFNQFVHLAATDADDNIILMNSSDIDDAFANSGASKDFQFITLINSKNDKEKTLKVIAFLAMSKFRGANGRVSVCSRDTEPVAQEEEVKPTVNNESAEGSSDEAASPKTKMSNYIQETFSEAAG